MFDRFGPYRHSVAFVLVSALTLVSCSGAGQEATAPDPLQPFEDLPQGYSIEDASITLERTVCYGSCPVYTVTIAGDGSVRYDGQEFVAQKGRREADIEVDQFAEVLDQVYRIRFFHMQDYDAMTTISVSEDGMVKVGTEFATDLPSQIITVRVGEHAKRVTSYYGAPAELLQLTDQIDAVAGTERWIEP